MSLRRSKCALFAIVSSASMAACANHPTSPTNAVPVSTYEGAWVGVGKRSECGSVTSFCDGIFQLAPFRLQLAQNAGRLEGTLTLESIRVTVVGVVDSAGNLSLTGNGLGIYPLTVSIASWRTGVSGSAMQGTFSLTARYQGGDSGTFPVTLEHVFKEGSPQAAEPLPTELRFALRVFEGLASRRGPPSQTPGRTDYNACFWIDNAASTTVRVTFTVTPMGLDGADYEVQQLTGANTSSVLPVNILEGCGGGATDFNYQRAIAPKYRLHVDYRYDDGAIGSAEGVGSVRILVNTLNSAPTSSRGFPGRVPFVAIDAIRRNQ